MNFTTRFGLGVIAATLAACAAPSDHDAPPTLEVEPQDFVLLPCGVAYSDHPCALAIAGGKRILFGAPSGVAAGLGAEDLRLLDAVIVFSLRAGDLEGLDEVRNESWRAGRDAPLLVIGPSGIDTVAVALNQAYEQADALRIVEEGFPPGGYDAAVLNPRAYADDDVIFDTGDVVIEATDQGFRMTYNAQSEAILKPCQARGDIVGEPAKIANAVIVSCEPTQTRATWPLTQPIILVDN